MTCIQYKDYKDHFKVVSKIGDGNCASVVKVQDLRSKKQYALKYSKIECPAKLTLAFQEIEVVRALGHPVAVEIYYYFVKKASAQFIPQNIELGIIMELADRSLQQDIFMRRAKENYYAQEEVYDLLKSLLRFFAHAQQKGYLHRDIKPANILIMYPDNHQELLNPAKEKFKVCDFGFAIKNHQFSDKNIAGTASYASPKILSKFQNSQTFVNGNNFKDDVYSLGITMLQLCTLQSPEQTSPKRLLLKTNNRYGIAISSLLKLMVEFDQNKRPDFIQLSQILTRILSKRGSQLLNPFSRTVEKSAVPDLKLVRQKIKEDLENLKQNQTAASTFAVQNEATQEKKNGQQDNLKKALRVQFLSNLKRETMADEKSGKDQENINTRNLTPKINKNLQNCPISIQDSGINSPKKENLSNDRAKTKRRSKVINNYTVMSKMGQENLTTKGMCEFTVNQRPDQIKRNTTKSGLNKVNQSLNNFTIKDFKIKQLEVIELTGFEKENQRGLKLIVLVNGGKKLYAAFGSWDSLKQISISEGSWSIQLIKYATKKKELIIVCQNGAMALLNLLQIFNLIEQSHASIGLDRFRTMPILKLVPQTKVVEVSPMGAILKGYYNGSITEDDKLILETSWKGKVCFVQRLQSYVFLATREGVVSKFKINQNKVSTMTSMVGYYNCKSSIIGFSVDIQCKDSTPTLTIITTTGFVFRLDSDLSNQKLKKISHHCLRVCSIFESGKKILAADSLGNILNQNGRLVYPTNMDSILQLKVVQKGRKVLLANEEGLVREIVLDIDQQTI